MADFRAMLPLAAAMKDLVLKNGEHHGDSWVTELITTHIRHAADHIEQHMKGNVFDDPKGVETHLSHAAARLDMANELLLRELEAEKREARRMARCKQTA